MVTRRFETAEPAETEDAGALGEAIASCLGRLQCDVPFGRWTLTRMIGDEWVMLHVAGRRCGDLVRWDETICSRMTRDLKETFVPVEYEDARVSAPLRKSFDVGAYIGVALFQGSGEPLGTLGSVDTRRRRQPPRGRRQIDALQHCGRLIVELIGHAGMLMRSARSAAQELLSETCGSRWLTQSQWRTALASEDEVRRPLAAPAAVLAVAIKDGLLLRQPVPGATDCGAHRTDAVLDGLAPGWVGTRPRPSTLLVLVPECDQERARRIETQARLLFESRGVKARCGAVSARFDEPLRKAEAAALRAVR